MKALILNVGNEVLTGRVINTNSSYIAKELSKVGITVQKVVVVGDEKLALKNEVKNFIDSDNEVLITTGGLGPTHDDFTKEVICEELGLELVLREDALTVLENYFNKNYADSNYKQAFFPKDAILIENKIGTADGAIIEVNGKTIILLVGPPYELQLMMKDVLTYFKKNSSSSYLVKEYIIMGEGESNLEDRLKPVFAKYPNVEIAPYASLGKIRYQITANKDNKKEFNNAIVDFEALLKNYIISDNLEEVEEVIYKLLKKLNYKISFAESCTGGMIASKMVNVSGVSSVFNESLVTYSNDAKTKYLNVSKELLNDFGAVSKEVAEQMVLGLFNLTKSEVCVSVTGIAGPDGGSKEKPVGLVWYAIKVNEQLIIESKVFKGNRDMVRTRTTLWVLYRVFQMLKSKLNN